MINSNSTTNAAPEGAEEADKQLLYVYAEYCPGDFFWGWWLYSTPIVDGLPDRDDDGWDGCQWLNRADWKVAEIFRALGIHGEWCAGYRLDSTRCAEVFMQNFPNGALVYELPHHDYEAAGEVEGVELWRCLKTVRESQLLDWKNSDESYLGKREAEMRNAQVIPSSSTESSALAVTSTESNK